MIETVLADKLKRIFALKKVTFDMPGESLEQDTLFIDLQSSKTSVKDGRIVGRVEGTAVIYSRREKMPIGYFARCIANAPNTESKDFFFLDIDESNKTYQDLVERSLGFIFFFDSQYDPSIGTITTLETQ